MSDGPDLLERVRMCLAEVGVDPTNATRGPAGLISYTSAVGWREGWQAAQLARVPDGLRPFCWQCRYAVGQRCDPADLRRAHERCQAVLPLTEDCGVERG